MLFRIFARQQKGFTLIELMVVIALLGVLSVAIISIINPVAQFQKSRDASRKSDIRQLQAALEAYRAQNGQYPDSSTKPFDNCGNEWKDANGVSYLQSIPCDPNSTASSPIPYQFISCNPAGGNFTTYTLRFCSEYVNPNDPELDGNLKAGADSTNKAKNGCDFTPNPGTCPATSGSYTYINP